MHEDLASIPGKKGMDGGKDGWVDRWIGGGGVTTQTKGFTLNWNRNPGEKEHMLATIGRSKEV